MIIIRNDILPFKGFVALTVWPFVFVRQEYEGELKRKGTWGSMLNHEEIHGEQQKEMLAFGVLIAGALAIAGCGWWSLLAVPVFFWWYGVEWLLRLGGGDAYRRVSLEREAYDNEGDNEYVMHRDSFAWMKYLKGDGNG